MRTPETITLPVASEQYGFDNEQLMRRSAEQAFQDLRSDVVENRHKSNRDSSLAIRRFQFLLMGA